MHDAVLDWVSRWATTDPVAVLDIGGRDVNGTVRPLFPAAEPYRVLDLAPGPNVDLVADAADWNPDRAYDVVVCTEVLEHAERWRDIVATAFRALTPGGRFIVTAASPRRPPHSGRSASWELEPGEHYAGVPLADLANTLHGAGFVGVVLDEQESPADVRAVAWAGFRPAVGPLAI